MPPKSHAQPAPSSRQGAQTRPAPVLVKTKLSELLPNVFRPDVIHEFRGTIVSLSPYNSNAKICSFKLASVDENPPCSCDVQLKGDWALSLLNQLRTGHEIVLASKGAEIKTAPAKGTGPPRFYVEFAKGAVGKFIDQNGATKSFNIDSKKSEHS